MNVGRSTLDLWVGIFVAIGIGAILFLALKVGNLISFASAPGYRIEARFDNIGGLKLRAPVKAAVDFRYDIVNGIIKSVVFGVAVSMIAVFEGFDARPTAEGVSSATTRTVVETSLAILALDFVLTVFMFRGIK